MLALRVGALLAAVLAVSAALAFRAGQPAAGEDMKTTKPGPIYSKAGYDVTPLPQARIDELAKKLKPDEAAVILNKGTEPAFCGNLVDNHKDGVCLCRLCGLPLFRSDAKFDSGTGWPSFFQPVDPAHVVTRTDSSYGMSRDEILCARCGAHLGHVFSDAPQTPTGLRFCLNSVSLTFAGTGAALPPESQPVKVAAAYFAGGCFWGTEDLFQQVPGVVDVVSGYMGGTKDNPTYEEVCSGATGHAETVRVVFDPARVSYPALLTQFFRFHDPTQLNRQGPDFGTQYRSAIFATDDAQYEAAKAFIEAQKGEKRFVGRIIATQVVPAARAGRFYPAEEYHQDYHMKHGGHCALPTE